MKADTFLELTEGISQESQSSCKVLSQRAHLCKPSFISLEVSVTGRFICVLISGEEDPLASAQPAWVSSSGFCVMLLFHTDNPLRGLKGNGVTEGRDPIRNALLKSQIGRRPDKRPLFLCCSQRDHRNPCGASFVFLWDAQLWQWSKHNLDAIITIVVRWGLSMLPRLTLNSWTELILTPQTWV